MWPFKRKCPVCRSKVVSWERSAGFICEQKRSTCSCGAVHSKPQHERGYWSKTCVDAKVERMRDLLRSEAVLRTDIRKARDRYVDEGFDSVYNHVVELEDMLAKEQKHAKKGKH